MTQQTESTRSPSVDELIEDPLVGLLMARDGVEPETLRRLIARVRDRRRVRQVGLAA